MRFWDISFGCLCLCFTLFLLFFTLSQTEMIMRIAKASKMMLGASLAALLHFSNEALLISAFSLRSVVPLLSLSFTRRPKAPPRARHPGTFSLVLAIPFGAWPSLVLVVAPLTFVLPSLHPSARLRPAVFLEFRLLSSVPLPCPSTFRHRPGHFS